MAKLPGYSTAIVCSVSLHALLLAIVIVGWVPERESVKVRPSYIQATLLQVKPATKPVTKKQATKKPVKPKAVKSKPVDNKQAKLAEQKRAEAKRLAQTKRKEQLRLEKRQSEERAKKERLRKENEQEKVRQAKETEALRRQQELAFAEALNDEEAYNAAEQDAQLVGSYSAYVRDRIVSKWSRPPSARRGMMVELSIRLVPTGRVISVAIEKSSGNSAFDRSAEQAVYKVEQFEKLQELSRTNPRVFESSFRQFRLVFTPDDLRQ